MEAYEMATLQVRSIDDQLYEALGRRAARDNRSISQEVVAILKEHLAQPVQQASATEKFLELCGTWQDEREAAEIAKEIRTSRKTGGRFKDSF
jgi:plasmid stability protein